MLLLGICFLFPIIFLSSLSSWRTRRPLHEKGRKLEQGFALTVNTVVCRRFRITLQNTKNIKMQQKQARKSSEDAQAAGYARFEKVWAR